ncbi:hypothetical protein GCM10023194_25360 [Planotetraspora phitsanulokensis]|uniref:Uncharacterized protein n=1 Tax=Planotetraspora phitsanulokensis TaxID=575192 RepID=A0A8J3XMM4_9ACTN|nr:hypothetical protein Pph01_68860 [Planotetraspora phitsanulokensis]
MNVRERISPQHRGRLDAVHLVCPATSHWQCHDISLSSPSDWLKASSSREEPRPQAGRHACMPAGALGYACGDRYPWNNPATP